jgi:beta-1,4-mannooligosaccharide/beta-1,4-mannosyl-N-acetylglucosamine phosphorylase
MSVPATLVFNAGVIKFDGRYLMAYRNDFGFRDEADFRQRHPEGAEFQSTIGLAESDDGVNWKVRHEHIMTPERVASSRLRFANKTAGEEIIRTYDPRLHLVDGVPHLTFACDTRHGLRGGIAVGEDLEQLEVLDLSLPDNRNMVLFPERIGGDVVRLERPMNMYRSAGGGRFSIWIGRSRDLRRWGDHDVLLGLEDVPWANDKLGPGAPPIRTKAGWLVLFHAVDVDERRGKNGWGDLWQKRYTAGAILLDLAEPASVIGICREPVLVPEAAYEVRGGYRNNVVFPTGAVLEPDGELKIYYGAADTHVCLATASVDELVEACLAGGVATP